jgi:hypothetical protein
VPLLGVLVTERIVARRGWRWKARAAAESHRQALGVAAWSTGDHRAGVTLVMYLVIVGVLLWLVDNYIPMDRKISQIIDALVVVVVVVWLLRVFGVMEPLSRIGVG